MVADDRNSRGKREEEVSTTLVGSHLPGHFASVWRALRRRLVAEGLYWLPSIDEFMLLLLCFNLTSFVLFSSGGLAVVYPPLLMFKLSSNP